MKKNYFLIFDFRRDSEAEIAYNKGRQAVVRMLGKNSN